MKNAEDEVSKWLSLGFLRRFCKSWEN